MIGSKRIDEIDYATVLMVLEPIHGPGIDDPLVWYEGSGTADWRSYHADERGSIAATRRY